MSQSLSYKFNAIQFSALNLQQCQISRINAHCLCARSDTDYLLDTKGSENEATVQCSQEVFDQMNHTIASLQQQLDTEMKLRIKAQDDFKKVSGRWKQIAQELGKLRSEAKPFHIVTDDYLKQLVAELRYDVRYFSESYFEGLPLQRWPQRNEGKPTTKDILPEEYRNCPVSAVLAQSFIWRLLKTKVFERYQWPANDNIGVGLNDISRYLRPSKLCAHSCGLLGN